ncbi:hypothetical protein GCM10023143_00850 [Compostibacter hankyongensis]|uniref:Uncharacterized protein n=1 Tax=Compostibacter hankyongensis TaxID=1007089 RepID=A0ABP8FBY5_9BACT
MLYAILGITLVWLVWKILTAVFGLKGGALIFLTGYIVLSVAAAIIILRYHHKLDLPSSHSGGLFFAILLLVAGFAVKGYFFLKGYRERKSNTQD